MKTGILGVAKELSDNYLATHFLSCCGATKSR